MTIGSHQTSIGKDQARFTPRWILDPLGPFDTDAAAGAPRSFDIGTERNLTALDNSLAMDWRHFRRTWLNPPFDRRWVGKFVRKMCAHNHGILLLHVRPETEWFRPLFSEATGLLFLSKRVVFCNWDGSPCTITNPTAKHFGKSANSGAPVVLAAFGFPDADLLSGFDLGNNPTTELRGSFLPILVPRGVLALAIADDPSWRELVLRFLREQRGPVPVAKIYDFVSAHAKAQGKKHAREKVRQTLQRGAGRRVGPDQWVAA
jgi:hypothetical protein